MKSSGSWYDGLFEISLLQMARSTINSDDASIKIGRGGFGSVYKSVLGDKDVAIKRFDGSMSPRIIDARSMKHPNIITILGVEYNETPAVIYEFMPCGNLEDHLICKDNKKPLSSDQRIKIITEICQALMYMHSFNPPIIHGNLKPQNVLFDANLVTKLSDFGMSWMKKNEKNYCIPFGRMNGSYIYMDPEFLLGGKMSPSSDVYSFGLIILRILTGRSPYKFTLRKFVNDALETNSLDTILDESAGRWPIKETEQLARVAVMCCEVNVNARPNLVRQVWNVVRQASKTISDNASLSSPSSKSVFANRPERKKID